MMLPAWIRSRWVIVPAVLTISIVLWNIYVTAHDGGLVEGSVIDAAGRPVPGATVTLFERSFVAYTSKDTTKADDAGLFRFTNSRNHALQLEAESPTLGKSERHSIRLWFRAQNFRLVEPLRLAGRQP